MAQGWPWGSQIAVKRAVSFYFILKNNYCKGKELENENQIRSYLDVGFQIFLKEVC